jgi:hypothetical protein
MSEPSVSPQPAASPGREPIVKVRGNSRVIYADNVDEATRFVSEMNYLNYFVGEIARALGVRNAQFGILQEEGGQIVFKNYACVDSDEIETHGQFVKPSRELGKVLANLP